ncbi:MAG: PilN domain-containing protein [Bdellovibrionales bacterium]|nr:PilN domain-containing protein [Bdellovibrionales bacterium]
MIRINLAVRKQASYVGGGTTRTGTLVSSGRSSSFAALRMFSGETGQSLIKRIMIPIVLSIVVYFGSEYYMQQERERMAAERTQVEVERGKIQDELKRIKGFESVKSELERNELILRTKIATIEKLVKGRDFTLKSLVALTQALPREVWLTDLISSDVNYNIKGSTTDIGLISDLMTRLGKTIYFKDITLKNSSADPNGKIATFELTARKE